MNRAVIAAAMSLCLVTPVATSFADTLIMRDGTRVEGTVVSMASRTITFRHADGILRRYPTNRVEAVQFISAERANPRAVDASRLEAAAGTELIVRTVETIDSRTAGADQNFSAIVKRDVTNAAGRVIVPDRASVQLVIRAMASDGRTGSPEIALDIQSITVDGRKYSVSTADLSVESETPGKKKRAALDAVGGSGAVGTITGGTGPEVLTRGRDVRIPAETVITFRLDRAVTLQPAP
jgi:hypothetical protein